MTCYFPGLSNSHTPVRPPSTSSTGSRGRWVLTLSSFFFLKKNFKYVFKVENYIELLYLSLSFNNYQVIAGLISSVLPCIPPLSGLFCNIAINRYIEVKIYMLKKYIVSHTEFSPPCHLNTVYAVFFLCVDNFDQEVWLGWGGEGGWEEYFIDGGVYFHQGHITLGGFCLWQQPLIDHCLALFFLNWLKILIF